MKGAKVIIKKVRKRGHEGGHGGSSWKVAYADFVTAMMAFFLMLWLLAMVSDEKRARLEEYFKHFALFDQTGKSVMEGQVQLISVGSSAAPNLATDTDTQFDKPEGMSKEELMEKLKLDIEERLADVKDQVMVDIFEGGVRIQLVDKEGKPMFALGSANPTPQAKKILAVITDNVKEVDHRIAIEGHTDALTYSTSKYTNWELSTERASSARKELEINGMSPDRLTRVAGYAATDPLINDDPTDPRNRRISIMLLFEAEDQKPGRIIPPEPPPGEPEKKTVPKEDEIIPPEEPLSEPEKKTMPMVDDIIPPEGRYLGEPGKKTMPMVDDIIPPEQPLGEPEEKTMPMEDEIIPPEGHYLSDNPALETGTE